MGMKQNHYLFHADTVSGDMAWLDENESHHARHVLRIKEGDDISVTDGNGNVFSCKLDKTAGKRTRATILKQRRCPPPSRAVEVMIGLPAKNAFEDALKGLAALGVAGVVPVDCEHCRRKWWKNRWEKHHERLRRTIIAAAKQSLNPHFMALAAPLSLQEALENRSEEGLFYATEKGRLPGELFGSIELKKNARVTCIIGPPGGFSPTELSELEKKRASPLRLAQYRLRTELAAVVMAGFINMLTI